MALSIRNPDTEALARRVASERQLSITQAIHVSLEDAAERAPDPLRRARYDAAVARARAMIRNGPVDWSLTDDDILGYDDDGLFGRRG